MSDSILFHLAKLMERWKNWLLGEGLEIVNSLFPLLYDVQKMWKNLRVHQTYL